MILYSDATTPFGRKVLVAAMERAIPVTEEFVNLASPGPFLDVTAIGQIPALSPDQGDAIFDSDVILDFLDTCHHQTPLIPAEQRHSNLTMIHLANNLMESVLLRIMEIKRPDGEKSQTFIRHLETRADRVIARLEKSASSFARDVLDGKAVTLACALEYADFRYRETWREDAPALADWLAEVSQRPSMVATRPTRSAPVNSPLA